MINKPIYLDYCSTTPLDERVFDRMLPFFKNDFGKTIKGICFNSVNTIIGDYLEKHRKFNFEIASIQNPHEEIIDSIILSDDKANFDLYYTPNKSTNYNIYIDNVIDSTFLSPSYIYFSESKIKENYEAILESILKEKPTGIKGNFVLSAFLTSTMGVSYKLKLPKNI